MISRRHNLGLPRQVVAWYLFFCLVAVCWLATGLLDASHKVVQQRNAEAAVSRLSRSAIKIEKAFQEQSWQGLDRFVTQLRSQGQFAYCSLLDQQGIARADTRDDLVGVAAIDPVGSIVEESGVWGTQVRQESGLVVTEYRLPLHANGENFGTLLAANAQTSTLASFADTINAAPSAIAIPLLLILVGGGLIAKLTRSVATVETQLKTLAQLPAGDKGTIVEVPTDDLAALGWNRLVEQLNDVSLPHSESTLEDRIEALAQDDTNDQLAVALSSLSEGIALTDMEGRLQFANDAIKALLDSQEDFSKPLPFAKHLLESIEELTDEQAFDEQNRDRQVATEAIRTIKGKPHVLRIVRQPQAKGEGLAQHESQGHVWIVRDVTQQKLAEKSRDRFLDAATHELRTPLANIKAYAETLATAEALEVEKQKEFCNIINSEVTRLSRFVDDLLSISSLEVGSMSVDLRPTDIARLFDEVMDKVRPLLGQKGHTLDVRLPEKLAEMSIDKDKVIAVLVNLLGNAAKYTPKGGHVGLKVKRTDKGLSIAVEDSGVGIAKNETEKVFEKFFRSEDPRVQEEVGSGLGLSLAREVARMHGGEITCESVLNEGTTFTFDLPSATEVNHARR